MKSNYRPHNGMRDMVLFNNASKSPYKTPANKQAQHERFEWLDGPIHVLVNDREITPDENGSERFAVLNRKNFALYLAGIGMIRCTCVDSGINAIHNHIRLAPNAALDRKNNLTVGNENQLQATQRIR